MLRLVIALPEGDRNVDPVVLYCGHDADAAQTIIDNAPPEHEVIHQAQIPATFRARRNTPTPTAKVPSDGLASDGTTGEEAPTEPLAPESEPEVTQEPEIEPAPESSAHRKNKRA